MTIVIKFLSLPWVQVALASLVFAGLGVICKRFLWARKIALLAAQAYRWVEENSGLKGFEKLKPFMDRLIKLIQDAYGRDATPEERGLAIEKMEKIVAKENRFKLTLRKSF